MVQYDRDYSLYLGWQEDGAGSGVLIKGLQIEFDIDKVINNRLKANTSTIKIYNLTPAQATLLQKDQLSVRLLVGYKNTTLSELCLGNVIETSTVKDGTDRVTTLTIGEAFSIMNNTIVSGTIPAGKTLRDVLKAMITQAGLAEGELFGEILETTLLWGYPLEGSFKQQMDEICYSYRLDYFVDKGRVSVRPSGSHPSRKNTAYVFNQNTGLLGIPFIESWNEGKKKKDRTKVKGIGFEALLNPQVQPGSIVKLERPEEQEQEIPNGWYYVVSAKYSGSFRGADWKMSLQCERIDE